MTDAQQYIHSRTHLGSRLGLGRISLLLERLGAPHRKLRFVHVAGTNGKGSTTTFIANILTAAGYRTGRYISPYVLEFNERISVDGVNISDEELQEVIDEIRPVVDAMEDDVTEFELITAAALCYYVKKECDVVVLEVGLGGRFDATNVIPAPECCVLTKISYDHMQYLGNTLPEIAFEKCGIIKEGSAVISYPFQFDGANDVIDRICKEKQVPLKLPNLDYLEIIKSDIDGSMIDYRGRTMTVPLAGRHQIYNAVTAMAAVEYLATERDFTVSLSHIAQGLKNTFFPARLEILQREPLVILDAAHNEDGMRTLCAALESYVDQRPVVALFGVFADKDYTKELELLAPRVNRFITLTPHDPRGLSGRELARLCEKTGKPTVYCEDYEQGYAQALEQAGKGGCVAICGCMHMASDLRGMILK